MTIADQLVVLQAGAIAQVGTPAELYRRPANTFVAGFIGSPATNLLPREVFPLVAGHGATLGVRPEDVLVSPSADGDGVVELVELLGPRYVFIVRVGGERVTAVVEAAAVAGWPAVPVSGDRVALDVRADHVHLFDAAGERVA